MFYAAADILVRGTNDENKMGQAFVWTVSCY